VVVRRALPFIGAAAIVAILVIGLTQAGDKGGAGASTTKAKPFDLH
jgi:hypothetical protein